jgi:cathepsin C
MCLKYSILSVILSVIALTNIVKSDTPANCTYEDIKGVWVFHEGPRLNDKNVNCSAKSNSKNEF